MCLQLANIESVITEQIVSLLSSIVIFQVITTFVDGVIRLKTFFKCKSLGLPRMTENKIKQWRDSFTQSPKK